MHAALAVPSVAKRLIDMGGTPTPTTPEAAAALVASQVKRWKEVVAAAGIKGE